MSSNHDLSNIFQIFQCILWSWNWQSALLQSTPRHHLKERLGFPTASGLFTDDFCNRLYGASGVYLLAYPKVYFLRSFSSPKLSMQACVYTILLMMKFITLLFCCLATIRFSLAKQATPATTPADVKAAYTTSSTIFLPSALFDPLPRPQNVTGQVATTGHTTYYSLTYELGTRYFNPNHVPLTVGGYEDTFVFTASADGTLYALPQ